MNYADLQLIEKSPFFKGLPHEACIQLATVCKRKETSKRDVIFTEGTSGNEIYLLAEGTVQLNKATPDGNEVVIRTIKEGEVFAEVILFEQNKYPVTAISTAKSTLLSFERKDFLHLLDNNEFRNAFIRSLMMKQRYLAERVRYLTSYDVEQRLFMFLEEHYEGSSKISIDLSKKDMAAAIGTTPETFSRLIKTLKDEKKLTWNGKALEIL